MYREQTPATEAPLLQWQQLGLGSASQDANIDQTVTDVELNCSS